MDQLGSLPRFSLALFMENETNDIIIHIALISLRKTKLFTSPTPRMRLFGFQMATLRYVFHVPCATFEHMNAFARKLKM
jgi:hypothetical protein